MAKQINEIKRLLATNKSLVNSFMYGYRKQTLLHKATQIGHLEVCELLIDHGADVNKQDARKQTSLWVAAEEGHTDICKVLIQNGASVDKKDVAKRTPFWIAAHKKHYDVCKILIHNGASFYEKDGLGIGVNDGDECYSMFKQWDSEYGKMFNLYTFFPVG